MTVPIILEAEKYEGGEHAASHVESSTPAQARRQKGEAKTEPGGVFSRLYQGLYTFQHAESEWEPEDGWQRNGSTLVDNILIAIAFSLLLVSAFTLCPDMRWTERLL